MRYAFSAFVFVTMIDLHMLVACSSVTAPVESEITSLRPRRTFGCVELGGYGIDAIMSTSQRASVLDGLARWNASHADAVTSYDVSVSDTEQQCLITLPNTTASNVIAAGGAFNYSGRNQRLTVDLDCSGLCPAARVYAGLGFLHGDDWPAIESGWPGVENCSAGVGC